MAAITATFWTITREKMYIAGPQKRLLVKAVLAAGEVPSALLPGPAYQDIRVACTGKQLDFVLLIVVAHLLITPS